MLIVECYYPHKNPAKVDIDVIFLFIIVLLYSGPSLTDCWAASLQPLCIIVLKKILQRILQIAILHEDWLEVGLIYTLRYHFMQIHLWRFWLFIRYRRLIVKSYHVLVLIELTKGILSDRLFQNYKCIAVERWIETLSLIIQKVWGRKLWNL